MNNFTHFDTDGNALMVDVHDKSDTHRIAVASGKIYMSRDAFMAVKEGTVKKGDVLSVARIAGIMGAKKNSDLIPLCHNITLTKCEIDFVTDEDTYSITVICTASCVGKTGVEMEALMGVNIALLTIYDMCKAIDRGMVMGDIHLLNKEGGKSGYYEYNRNNS